VTEVAVAFPNDETTAEVIASRLRAEGIAARVDRGLYGAYLSPMQGQLTVVVDSEDEGRARKLVDTHTRPRKGRP
jgi:predicted transcriptional regulator of viral defense system